MTESVRVDESGAKGVSGDGLMGATRAARELGLMRGEFELAVDLGHIRTSGRGELGRRRIARAEIGRLRSAEDFPDCLREQVRTVGTAAGAELMGISPGRFTRLARAGLLMPARFYLNRYRAVVWLYLAQELAVFAAGEPLLLSGRLPFPLRTLADDGDRRARNWRTRRIGALLRQAGTPWERVAAASAALAPPELHRLVPDAADLARVVDVRPQLVSVRPATERAAEVLGELVTARDGDEIAWYGAQVEGLMAVVKRRTPTGSSASTGHGGAGDAASASGPAAARQVPVPAGALTPRPVLVRSEGRPAVGDTRVTGGGVVGGRSPGSGPGAKGRRSRARALPEARTPRAAQVGGATATGDGSAPERALVLPEGQSSAVVRHSPARLLGRLRHRRTGAAGTEHATKGGGRAVAAPAR